MKRLGLIILLCLSLCLIFFSSSYAGITGPHNILHVKGVCANCHIPHKAKGLRIWARDLLNKFGGTRQLCNSCHDGTLSTGINPSDPNSPEVKSGIETVFIQSGDRFESHVMHGAADISEDEWLGPYNSDVFRLRPDDSDNVSGHPPEWDQGGAGFYCGSCHNPHSQHKANGDYLRTTTGDIGEPENRTPFCKECHNPIETGNSHLNSGNCQICHHPHEGFKRAKSNMPEKELKIVRLIFKAEVIQSEQFIASPNVPEITEDPNDISKLPAAFCYGCHQPHHLLEQPDEQHNLWRDQGAAPIYGDKYNGIENTEKRRNHHPMGTQTSLIRADVASEYLNQNGELTCISCHLDLHGQLVKENFSYDESKANNFLREIFINDNARFCILCHKDKAMKNDEVVFDNKHFWDTNSPVPKREVFDKEGQDYTKKIYCRECMFCHFIHDGEEREENREYEVTFDLISPDIDALMRIAPNKLKWGERLNDEDPYDYEDMCYGCHGNESIVSRPDFGIDALLKPDSFFTHRFASPPDPNSFTIENIIPGGPFPLADGPDPATEAFDDYGTQAGNIYCGTCHNVHAQYDPNSPYLNSGKSPYVANGFCEACHDKDGQFISNSHPIDVGPNPDPNQGTPTAPGFVDTYGSDESLFYHGGSGRPGGITYPYDPAKGKSTQGKSGKVICLTCHNTHAAITSWEGKTETDKSTDHGYLLVKDNMKEKRPTSPGSELCKACHPFGESEYSFPEGNHGDGTLSDGKGICSACHIPHGTGTDEPKLWSIKCGNKGCYSLGPFTGTRQLCFTCHNSESSQKAITGIETVFKGIKLGEPIPEEYPEDHVMWNWADIEGVGDYDRAVFPLDSNDRDEIPRGPGPEPDPHDGFYCGSCHNPHLQPHSKGGGRYLRSKDGNVGFVVSGKPLREEFCNECHINVHSGAAGECMKCHSVHTGAVLLSENETEGRWILIDRVQRTRFVALPNVQSLNEDPNDLQKTDSPFCYGCHGPKGSQKWLDAGAMPIYGDDSSTGPKEHHPMGNQATKESPRASIPTNGEYYYNDADELTCKSCHDDIHGPGHFADEPDIEQKAIKAKENYYLRWKLNEGQDKDQVIFCIACHTDKLVSNLSGKHLIPFIDSPNGRGNCMFCHFIHDGEERQSNLNLIPNKGIRADVDALMKQPAIPLIWKVQEVCSDDTCIDNIDNDPYDYEDMCYGCHGDPNIVKGTGSAGSLLQPAKYFTHRYSCVPDPNSPTSANIEHGGIYPLSDGPGLITLNDYGTVTGHIFCGSCHNVHDGLIKPYLNHAKEDKNLSPDNGFCEACHDENGDGSGEFLEMSHPVTVGPNPSVTVSSWEDIPHYFLGGSGKPFGITGDGGGAQGTVICLTCHNVHACATSYDGKVPGKDDNTHGILLIKDNYLSPEGSDMCQECHKPIFQ